MFNIIFVVYRVDVNELLPLNQLIIAVVSEISFFIEKTGAHCSHDLIAQKTHLLILLLQIIAVNQFLFSLISPRTLISKL